MIAHSASNVGRDVGELAGGPATGAVTVADLDAVLEHHRPDVLLYAGIVGPALVDLMRRCLERGIDYINASFVHPPTALGADVALELDRLAKSGGARGLGTDVTRLLARCSPRVLATAMEPPVRLRGRRVTDIRPWGRDVLVKELGVGRTDRPVLPRFHDALTESRTSWRRR